MFLEDGLPVMITLSATRRSDGMFDYWKDGPATYKKLSALPPVYEKIEGQMQANGASHEEIERFIDELNLFGTATLSFPERLNKFKAVGAFAFQR